MKTWFPGVIEKYKKFVLIIIMFWNTGVFGLSLCGESEIFSLKPSSTNHFHKKVSDFKPSSNSLVKKNSIEVLYYKIHNNLKKDDTQIKFDMFFI